MPKTPIVTINKVALKAFVKKYAPHAAIAAASATIVSGGLYILYTVAEKHTLDNVVEALEEIADEAVAA